MVCLFSVVPPPMDSYIFMKVNEKVEGVLVEEETADNRY